MHGTGDGFPAARGARIFEVVLFRALRLELSVSEYGGGGMQTMQSAVATSSWAGPSISSANLSELFWLESDDWSGGGQRGLERV